MSKMSKSVCINKLADLVNAYHIQLIHTIEVYVKMRPIDVKLSIYIDFGVENDDKYHEFENGDQAKISKYNKI